MENPILFMDDYLGVLVPLFSETSNIPSLHLTVRILKKWMVGRIDPFHFGGVTA